MNEISAGILISVLAGIINGSFATPTKYTTRWEWENIWGVWAITALLVVPWVVAFWTVPHLFFFYGSAGAGLLVFLIALGLGFGFSQIFFGLALDAIGLSIGFAVAIGLSTAIGSVVPFLMLGANTLLTRKGFVILTGVGLILVGTAICGIASHRRDAQRLAAVSADAGAAHWRRGLLFCILAGVLSPLENVALASGTPILQRAAQRGIGPASRANIIWPVVLTAALIPYIAYCARRWSRRKTWSLYSAPATGHYWLFGAVMGILWTGSLVLYGYTSNLLGRFGPVLGWPLFMSVIIITSNAWGAATGEWKGVRLRTIQIMLGGIAFLIAGFCAIATAS